MSRDMGVWGRGSLFVTTHNECLTINVNILLLTFESAGQEVIKGKDSKTMRSQSDCSVYNQIGEKTSDVNDERQGI